MLKTSCPPIKVIKEVCNSLCRTTVQTKFSHVTYGVKQWVVLNPVIIEERILLRIRKAKLTIFYYLTISGWEERRMKWRHLQELCLGWWLSPARGTALPEPQPWAGCQLTAVCQDLLEGGADANGNLLTNCLPSQLSLWKSPSKTKMMSQETQQDECGIPCHTVVGDRIERDVWFISQKYLGGKKLDSNFL